MPFIPPIFRLVSQPAQDSQLPPPTDHAPDSAGQPESSQSGADRAAQTLASNSGKSGFFRGIANTVKEKIASTQTTQQQLTEWAVSGPTNELLIRALVIIKIDELNDLIKLTEGKDRPLPLELKLDNFLLKNEASDWQTLMAPYYEKTFTDLLGKEASFFGIDLKHPEVSENGLTSWPPIKLATTSAPIKIYISGHSLSEWPSKMPAVHTLIAAGNQFTRLPPLHATSVYHSLDLRGNQIKDLSSFFPEHGSLEAALHKRLSSHLQQLNLCGNPISQIPKTLRTFTGRPVTEQQFISSAEKPCEVFIGGTQIPLDVMEQLLRQEAGIGPKFKAFPPKSPPRSAAAPFPPMTSPAAARSLVDIGRLDTVALATKMVEDLQRGRDALSDAKIDELIRDIPFVIGTKQRENGITSSSEDHKKFNEDNSYLFGADLAGDSESVKKLANFYRGLLTLPSSSSNQNR